jgi:hypothetical protein
MNINCNAGVTPTKLIVDLPGYGEVWYNPNGIANILSLSKVEEQYHVTYDRADDKGFTVHKGDGETCTFKKSKCGLFYFDITARADLVLLNTVADNQARYTVRSYKQAQLAHKVQSLIGNPSTGTYMHAINKNLLQNCPITRDDIMAAEDFLGPSVNSLKGKTVQHGGRHPFRIAPLHHGAIPRRHLMCGHHVCEQDSLFDDHHSQN